MKVRHIVTWIFVAYMAIFNQAHAVIFGGDEYGWTIDFDKVTPEQKIYFGWDDYKLKTNYKKPFSNTHTYIGKEWVYSGKAIASHYVSGPAYLGIIELLNGTTLEDLKKSQYFYMSSKGGFNEKSCTKIEYGAQSCEVTLLFTNESEINFFANFYQWETAGRTFVIFIRNAQSTPDKETPMKAIQALVPLITLTTPK